MSSEASHSAMSLAFIKDLLIILTLTIVCICHYEGLQKMETFTEVMKAMMNITEGRLNDYEARMKYFEVAMGETMIKDFLAKGEIKEGIRDENYAQMLAIISQRKRRNISAKKPKCDDFILEALKRADKIKGQKVFIQRIKQFTSYYQCQEEHYQWTPRALKYFDTWLTNPKRATPGTRFVFAGIKKKRERMHLIAYMSDKRWKCCRYPKVPFMTCNGGDHRCDVERYPAYVREE
eukprot:Seg1380.1 transcript_id=Seg1380.1/GoldUCD/mRNA.D3Y31 product="Cytochrome c" protein_id=Seg1380.1/GoldUCD/D3Y31